MSTFQMACRGAIAAMGIAFALMMCTSKERPWIRGFGMFLGLAQALMALGLK